MKTTTYFDVICSQCGKKASPWPIFKTPREAVHNAVSYGWQSFKGEPYCPKCLEKEVESSEHG